MSASAAFGAGIKNKGRLLRDPGVWGARCSEIFTNINRARRQGGEFKWTGRVDDFCGIKKMNVKG